MAFNSLTELIILCVELSGLLLALSFLYALLRALYNVYFHPLSGFPGPKTFAASSIPLARAALEGRLPYTIRALHERYGSVVRTAPNELAFSDGAAQRSIYVRRPAMQKDPLSYNLPTGGVHSILTVQSDADHARYRRLLAHAFSERALREQEPLIQVYVDLFISRLHENARKGPQEMVAWYNYLTFDIIGDLSLGESFHCLENSDYHPWVSLLFKAFKFASMLTAFRRILPFRVISALMKVLIPKSVLEARAQHYNFVKEKVLQRIDMKTDRQDFMTNVLRHNDETGMSVPEIIATFGLLLLAGSETTATLLAAVTFHLLQYPDVMKKLVAEIRSSFKEEGEINMVSVNSLKYQLAVLEEALRILPPTPNGPPRKVPAEGATISGWWVPGGTGVAVTSYSAYHQARNFKDPDLFVPERWLGDARYQGDDHGAFAPFSLGTRNCIGRNLAYAEMRLILARLLWNFDLELADTSRAWTKDMKMFILWEKPPLFVNLKPVVRQ